MFAVACRKEVIGMYVFCRLQIALTIRVIKLHINPLHKSYVSNVDFTV